MFKVNNKDNRTPLAFRIFDRIRHHSTSSASKNMFSGKVGDVVEKKLQKVKYGARVST